MEYFELLNRDGSRAGKIKERNQVHKDGDLHGGSHIWVARKGVNGNVEILLQKRRQDKDSFPGCYDVSSAGHVGQGENFEMAAFRELKEELNIDALKGQLIFLFSQYTEGKFIFHNQLFFNREINYVYLLDLQVPLNKLSFQKEEIQELKWISAEVLLDVLRKKDKNYCIVLTEYEKVFQYLHGEKGQKKWEEIDINEKT